MKSEVTPPKPSQPQPPPSSFSEANSSIIGNPKHAPTALDKIFLRWSGQFKAGQEIPPLLDGETIFKARSYGRIRVNMGFLLIAAVGSGLMIYSGKRAAARGESMERINLDWHRSNKEAYEKESVENKK